MGIRIHEVDVQNERDRLIAFLGDNLPGHGGEAHFDWLYRDNPDGTARAWFAVSDEAATPVGVAAAFPRRMWVRGRQEVCWNLGDFAITKEFRSLGPAMILQRACLQPVVDGQVPFAYDHPSCVMLAIYERMGIPETGRIVRFGKLLRVDEKVGSFVRQPVIAGGVSGVGNVVLSLVDRGLLMRRRHVASKQEGRWDERVTALDHSVSRESQVVGVRSAAYLNWRYLDNPLWEHEILTAEDDSRLVGYAVVRYQGDSASLVDLYSERDSEVVDGLIAAAIEMGRKRRVLNLSAPVLESSPLVPFLVRWGFRARESCPFVVSAPTGGELSETVRDAANWFLTAGDRDV